MQRAQNSLNYGADLCIAELASTAMEFGACRMVMDTADPATRLSLLIADLDRETATIFRQSASILFERDLHRLAAEKGDLSAAEIGFLFQEHMTAYMGPAVEQNPGSENWWVYWSQIHRTPFYNYSYAFARTIAVVVHQRLSENPGFMAEFKAVLAAGKSECPAALLMRLGIDITDPTFWQSGLVRYQSMVTEAEALARQLGKIK
jgi:oligoendopeptidase F